MLAIAFASPYIVEAATLWNVEGRRHRAAGCPERILQGGALLVPNDRTRQTMRKLTRYKPVWGAVMREKDLEKGLNSNWQIVDAHYVYPWTGK